jgi:predicted ATP-grasp superfamily ATP-dependent carboligase
VQSLNPDDLIKRIATGLGIETEGLIKSQEQMAQEQEAQEEQMQNEQMMQMAEKAVAPVANNATKPQPQ